MKTLLNGIICIAYTPSPRGKPGNLNDYNRIRLFRTKTLLFNKTQ